MFFSTAFIDALALEPPPSYVEGLRGAHSFCHQIWEIWIHNENALEWAFNPDFLFKVPWQDNLQFNDKKLCPNPRF